MLLAASSIWGTDLQNPQEHLGTLHDLMFRDRSWGVRYLVIDTGGWLRGRRVILAPSIVEQREWPARRLWTTLTQRQVEQSPPLEADMPVSRQKQKALSEYYGWGHGWAAPSSLEDEEEGDPHLRSAREVIGYHVQASDGGIGQIKDLIVDEEAVEPEPWRFRYLVVDTGTWLPGRQVLLAPDWADEIRHIDQTVFLGLPRERVGQSPEYAPDAPVNRAYEEVLFDYYGQPKYWIAREQGG